MEMPALPVIVSPERCFLSAHLSENQVILDSSG